MIAMNHRLVNTVINRCTMPADGGILVPIRTVSVIGTTGRPRRRSRRTRCAYPRADASAISSSATSSANACSSAAERSP